MFNGGWSNRRIITKGKWEEEKRVNTNGKTDEGNITAGFESNSS